jgi:hypothetical protein
LRSAARNDATGLADRTVDGHEVAGGNALRHAHAPGVEDKLLHLVLVKRGQAGVYPVIAQVGLTGHEELAGLGGDERLALLLREAEAHDLLVAREREEHDPPDPELDPISNQRLIGARQLAGELAHVIDGDHDSQPAAWH